MSLPLVCLSCGSDIAEKRLLFEALRPRSAKKAIFETISASKPMGDLLDTLEVRDSCCRSTLLCGFLPIPMILDIGEAHDGGDADGQ